MLKIFSTQLQGIFKKIEETEDFHFEEGARLLAQAVVSDGTVYVHGFDELKAVELTATIGPERLKSSKSLFENGKMNQIEDIDRILIVTRSSNDVEAIELAKDLSNRGLSVVAISNVVENGELASIVDVHINSHLVKALIPDDEGNRYGYPTSIVALYAYYGLLFTIEEIASEY
ncbi:DUF2529 domain-containing protein [Bacillus salitolerans]|uniref:DUF2529 domain-containing protein n=1 Tax=Bacillus salitolerans TaxID=1437434 RepID=A0ABW4LIT0_9BACI